MYLIMKIQTMKPVLHQTSPDGNVIFSKIEYNFNLWTWAS